ncbi:MAG: hypothetical protein AAGE52_14180 [Myxococcota bacterium]
MPDDDVAWYLEKYEEGVYTWGEIVSAVVGVLGRAGDPLHVLDEMPAKLRSEVLELVANLDPDTFFMLNDSKVYPHEREELRVLKRVLQEAGLLG